MDCLIDCEELVLQIIHYLDIFLCPFTQTCRTIHKYKQDFIMKNILQKYIDVPINDEKYRPPYELLCSLRAKQHISVPNTFKYKTYINPNLGPYYHKIKLHTVIIPYVLAEFFLRQKQLQHIIRTDVIYIIQSHYKITFSDILYHTELSFIANLNMKYYDSIKGYLSLYGDKTVELDDTIFYLKQRNLFFDTNVIENKKITMYSSEFHGREYLTDVAILQNIIELIQPLRTSKSSLHIIKLKKIHDSFACFYGGLTAEVKYHLWNIIKPKNHSTESKITKIKHKIIRSNRY